MLILAIDTSHKNGSVCLARGDAEKFESIGRAEVDGGMFSAELVPVIAKLLAKHGLTKNDLQGIAAAVGPGSFTGLRIGLAAVKGFAEVLKIPIAGVSKLEAVAASAENSEGKTILAALDAGRSEFYVGEYARGGLKKISESLLTREEFMAQIRNRKDICVVSPDSLVVDIAETEGAIVQQVLHLD